MKLLKDHKLPFGISTCYTSANYQDITSEEFFDMMIEDGALFAWFFHYMPVGNDAVPELMPNPDQRETFTAGSESIVRQNPSSPWISRTMPSSYMAA